MRGLKMIYVILGRSGSGKSTVERGVCASRPQLTRIISDTTRPIREGEKDEVDYHFINQNTFTQGITRGAYVEHTNYNDWFYGINKERFNIDSGNYICVTNPTGYYQLKNTFGDKVVGIVIHSNDKERVINYLHREEDPNVKECCRRFLADCKDFEDIENSGEVYHVQNVKNEIQATIKTVLRLIDGRDVVDVENKWNT